MRYSPSAGKLCLNRMPPRVPGGKRQFAVLIGRDAVFHVGNARIGIADRDFRDLPGGRDVLVQERGRYAKRRRDIVKASDLDVLRQDVLCVHVHTHQTLSPTRRTRFDSGAGSAHSPPWDLWHASRGCSPSRRRTNRYPSAAAADFPAAASIVRAACAAPFPRSARSLPESGDPGCPARGHPSSRARCGT